MRSKGREDLQRKRNKGLREDLVHEKYNCEGHTIMAERRMFTQKITEADNFTELPPTTQCLYFHLCMNADDDGFSNKIRQAMFNAHADRNDFEMLVQKRFIIPFDSGVIVIKHWRMHNLIRSDRYHKTDYLEERAALVLKDNGVYYDDLEPEEQQDSSGIPDDNQVTTISIPDDNQMEPEGSSSIGKVINNINTTTIGEENFEIDTTGIPKIPLEDGTEWEVPESYFIECVKNYPDIDIKKEFASMRMWSISNPTKKKTRAGVKRFVNNWLSKSMPKKEVQKDTNNKTTVPKRLKNYE